MASAPAHCERRGLVICPVRAQGLFLLGFADLRRKPVRECSDVRPLIGVDYAGYLPGWIRAHLHRHPFAVSRGQGCDHGRFEKVRLDGCPEGHARRAGRSDQFDLFSPALNPSGIPRFGGTVLADGVSFAVKIFVQAVSKRWIALKPS